MKPAIRILFCALLLSAGPLPAAVDSDDDVYKEDAIRPYVDQQSEETKDAEDLPLVIPPYPSPENLLEVDISRYGYPYRLFVDAGSVTVGDDRIVRYTAVLRSPSGVDNVSYEGVRCSGSRYKRYAYGSGGKFYPATGSQWKRIHQTRQDAHRKVLVDEYFCPLPGGDQAAQIVARLRRSGSTNDSFSRGEQ
jgi:hypothetical protein